VQVQLFYAQQDGAFGAAKMLGQCLKAFSFAKSDNPIPTPHDFLAAIGNSIASISIIYH
jgi:hypothetical protein